MPRKEVDYSKTIIYKIVCNDLTMQECYVGHTTDFTKRKYSHKFYALNEGKKDSNMKIYQTIRLNGGWDKWSMLEIEKYPCIDANEARARERYWFEQLSAKLNMQFPSRTIQEWQDTNKDTIREKKKTYHIENRDNNIAKAKKYNEENREHRKEYLKKYREEHKEEYVAYREANREKINQKKRERRAQSKQSLT